MKFNFFSLKKAITEPEQKKDPEVKKMAKAEYGEFDENVAFYYTNIINSLILYTYSSEELERMAPILIDPLAELYEELEYAFTPDCFESVFRNKFLDQSFKKELLAFKSNVEKVPHELWKWEFLDNEEIWKQLRSDANHLLNSIGISTRTFNDEFHTIIKIEGNSSQSNK